MTFHSIVALGLISLSAFAAEDPKQGNETYYGSGYTERAPEYGQVFFTFKTDCQPSQKAVREAIELKSKPLWKAINKKIITFNETDQKYWGDVKNDPGKPSSEIKSNPPGLKNGNKTAGKAVRVSVCDDQELSLDAPVGLVYSGEQTIGVRSSDLDWIEGVEKTVLALPQGKLKSDVWRSSSQIEYAVTSRTAAEMELAVKKQARLLATGPGSLYESDSKTLRFDSAHLLASRVAYSPLQNALVGSPLEKGKAPKVSLTLPFVYTIYAEGTDLVDPTNRRGSSGLQAEYKAKGTAVSEADFGEVSIVVSKGCLNQPENAGSSITTLAALITRKLEAFQNKKDPSLTDRFTMGNLEVSEEYPSPYTAVKWQETGDNPNQVVSYFDRCSGKTVDAPKNGQVSNLPKYFVARQTFQLRSSDFAAIISEVEELRNEFGGAMPANEARVVVGDAIGQVTEETSAKLLRQARESASACVFDPQGALADDVSAQRFQCAHLKSIRIESAFNERGRSLEFASPAAMAKSDAPGGVPATDELPIVSEKRDGETRPRMFKKATFAFDFQFVTADYVPSFKAPALP